MKHKPFWEQVVMGADLPTETIPGQPLIEIAGQHRVLIENHQGVTAYGCSEICVRVKYGSIRVCGNQLSLARMTKDQLVITGDINAVTLLRR